MGLQYSVAKTELGVLGAKYGDDDATIRSFILKHLQQNTNNTPENQYLMQCADWYEHDSVWGAFSPIEASSGYYWQLYDLSELEFAEGESSHLEFHSYKRDYDVQTYVTPPTGNLPYTGSVRQFRGKIWTRGT